MSNKISTKHTGPHNATPYPRSRLSPPIGPPTPLQIGLGPIELIKVSLDGKLRMLGEQFKQLQGLGEKLIMEAQMNSDIHAVPCSVPKRPGCTLHLYTREDGTNFLSIIAPEEWCGLTNLQFGGSYRLEVDMTWTRVDNGA